MAPRKGALAVNSTVQGTVQVAESGQGGQGVTSVGGVTSLLDETRDISDAFPFL